MTVPCNDPSSVTWTVLWVGPVLTAVNINLDSKRTHNRIKTDTPQELVMSFTFNRLVMGGNLVRDPEVKVLSPERTLATFSIAINHHSRGNDGEVRESVVFLDCEAWGRTAELVGEYLKKGSAVCCDGRLKQETWTDKEGHQRSRLRMVAERVQFVSNTRQAEGSENDGDEAHTAPAVTPAAATTTTSTGSPVHSAMRNARPVPPRSSRPAIVGEEPPF